MKSLFKTKFLLFALFTFLVFGCAEDSPSIGETKGGIDSNGGGVSGQGGSLARFTIVNNHLYVVTPEALFAYSIENPAEPVLKSKLPIWTNAETIFAMGNNLFLGTQNGVEILNISNPDQPSRVSTYSHITSCDPVVAKGNYAYATLRTGTNCNRGVNLLDVINISNINNPYAETSLDMDNPKGLGISGDFMYVCDNSVLKTFNIKTPNTPKYTANRNLSGCFDVIGMDGKIIVVTTEGVYQFETDSQGGLTLLSKISVE